MQNAHISPISNENEYERRTLLVLSHAVDAGSKDTCVLEVDDTEDVDTVDSLLDILPPPGMQVGREAAAIHRKCRDDNSGSLY